MKRILLTLALALIAPLLWAQSEQQTINHAVILDVRKDGVSPISCGWGECGLQIKRDTTTQTGGAFANTESPFAIWNRVGAGISSREFSGLIITETLQNSGEAVGLYLKTIRRGSVPAWAGTFELNDADNKPGPSVGIEVDMFTTGPATDPDQGLSSNGGRVRAGVEVVGGDEAIKQGKPASGAQGSYGVNVYATSNTPDYRWIFGGQFRDYRRSGVRLVGVKESNGWVPERAIEIKGEHVVGLDFSQGTYQSVIRLKEGMAYSYDEYDDKLVRYKAGKMEFLQRVLVNGQYVHKAVMVLDYATGEVRAKKFTATATP